MTIVTKDESPTMTGIAGRAHPRDWRRHDWRLLIAGTLLWAGTLVACQPKVQVEAPKEPITINLNIKLDADVRVRLEQSAKEDIQRNPGIF